MKEKVVKKEEILQYITEESIVELAKNLIKIPSPTGEENQLATFFAELYER